MELNRQQRRELERKQNKLQEWKKNWTYEQTKFFMQEVGKEVDKINDTTEKILDSCYAAAISDNTDLELLGLKKIVIEANAYMDEVKKYLANNGEEYFMKLEDKDLLEKIKVDVEDCMSKGKLKSETLSELKNKYKITPNVISNIWMKVKEDNEIPSKHTPKKFINKHVDKETLEDIKKDIKNKADTEEKEVRQAIIPKKEEEGSSEVIDKQKEEAINMFEVVESKIVLKGKCGVYEKTNEGVKDGEMFFKNLDEVEKYSVNEILKAQNHFEETISKLRSQHAKEIDNFIKHVDEVKAAFNYIG